jgi:hypothetical protein
MRKEECDNALTSDSCNSNSNSRKREREKLLQINCSIVEVRVGGMLRGEERKGKRRGR